MVITSLENDRIKNLVKLQKKKYRDDTNTYLVEGYHLVEEAYKANFVIEIFTLEGNDISFDVPITFVSSDVMKKISTMDTPSNIVALCKKGQYAMDTEASLSKLLLLDEIQDPGNLGTIIRSSVAFGIDMIILSENTVDLYNPKVLRATQGMYCHIPIVSVDASKAITFLKNNQYHIYGTNVNNGVDARTLNKDDKEKFCLIVGNEGNGVSKEIQAMCDKNLYIPMRKEVESLNVGVACSILLYELER
jgi:TrmH family RNA methyltransferase